MNRTDIGKKENIYFNRMFLTFSTEPYLCFIINRREMTLAMKASVKI